jgi:hypothetical protein
MPNFGNQNINLFQNAKIVLYLKNTHVMDQQIILLLKLQFKTVSTFKMIYTI